jgi:transcriptional regulator with XRE-family HTH domain
VTAMSRVELTVEQREFGKAVAAALREARTSADMTVRQVADKTGLSVDTLRTLEAGRVASPGFALICAITNAVGADLTAFGGQVTANVSNYALKSNSAPGPTSGLASEPGGRANKSPGASATAGRARARARASSTLSRTAKTTRAKGKGE